jgi:hypothetical protein
MQDRTAAFDAAIHHSHTVVVVCELWSAGLLAKIGSDLTVVSGEVSIDSTAAVRRSGQVQIVDESGTVVPLIGPSGRSGLEPYGNELVIRRGIRYADGSQELMQLGVFPISETSITAHEGTTVTLSFTDRSRLVSEAKFTNTYYIPSGSSYVLAAADMVDFCLNFPVNIDRRIETTSTDTMPQTMVFHESSDPWDNVQQLVRTVGATAYFDPDGALAIRDIKNPQVDPAEFTYEDNETSIVIQATRVLGRGPNAVVVTGETTDQKYRSFAYDNDPASPSYYFGSYGRVPMFVNDPLATSQAMADLSATTRLYQQLGLSEVITLNAIPHPAHDAEDIIHARLHVVGGE